MALLATYDPTSLSDDLEISIIILDGLKMPPKYLALPGMTKNPHVPKVVTYSGYKSLI